MEYTLRRRVTAWIETPLLRSRFGFLLLVLLGLILSISANSTNTADVPDMSNATDRTVSGRSSDDNESTTWFERYGVPEIPKLVITCTANSYADRMRCADGEAPQTLAEQNSTSRLKLDPWYHPDNDVAQKVVKTAGESCGISCASQLCYFSLRSYFDYVCGSPSSKDYQETLAEIKNIKKKHLEYRRLEDGRICWDDSPHIGRKYEDVYVTKEDYAMAMWYKDHVPRSNLLAREQELSKQCTNQKCLLSEDRGTFICGGAPGNMMGNTLPPTSFLAMMLLSLVLRLLLMI